MGFEYAVEKGRKSSFTFSKGKMTLEKAVELGEYDPKYLSIFPKVAYS
jgi:hypothetical protein